MVYEVTLNDSFEELKVYWLKQIKECSPENIILAFVEN